MSQTSKIYAADLFCGAGGFTTGLLRAAERLGLMVDLLAVNHWSTAIETHSRNHPGVVHYCESIEGVDPRKAVPSGRLHLLMASPECVHHSNARGGKPMNDQSRSTAWNVLHWAEALSIDHILIENVKEFQSWGPLHPAGHPTEFRPIESRKGELFKRFLSMLRALDYTVDVRVLNAADYGDATTRHRLFIQAKRGRRKPIWPEASHLKSDDLGLYPESQPWRSAREIIDWSLPGKSIYDRKKPLAPNTMRRIMAGLRKYSGLPFIVGAGGPTGQGEPASVEKPVGTVLTEDHRCLAQPFLVVLRNNQDGMTLDRPLPTLCANGNHMALCEPFVIGQQSCAAPRLTDDPLPTVATAGAISLVEPFLMPITHNGGDSRIGRSHSVDAPLPTLTTQPEMAVVEPYLIEYHGEKAAEEPRTRDVDRPLSTVDTSNRLGLVQPFMVNYHGHGAALSVDDPLDTVDCRDRYALVSPELVAQVVGKGEVVGILDIRFRMLQPHELAAAHSFPPGYYFAGTRDDRMKQVGNSVGVGQAEALCASAISSLRLGRA